VCWGTGVGKAERSLASCGWRLRADEGALTAPMNR
jgi:hypothetical protein